MRRVGEGEGVEMGCTITQILVAKVVPCWASWTFYILVVLLAQVSGKAAVGEKKRNDHKREKAKRGLEAST